MVLESEYGIPILPLAACAEVIPRPILAWGSFARGRLATVQAATLHFFVDDYRFRRLPLPADLAGWTITEPDFSHDPYSLASFLGSLYRRRAWAYACAEFGVRLIADLYCSAAHLRYAFLGLPRGWGAYAWRATRHDDPATWDARVAAAEAHAEGRPLRLLVVGGGKRAREWCRRAGERHFVTWLDSAWRRDVVDELEPGADVAEPGYGPGWIPPQVLGLEVE